IDGAGIDRLLAGNAGLAGALIVGAVPGREAQRLGAGAEMLVEPVAAHRGGRDEADRLVIDALHLVGLARLPRVLTDRSRPGVAVALAGQADEHRRRGMRMRLGVAAGLMLADPGIEAIARHRRLD